MRKGLFRPSPSNSHAWVSSDNAQSQNGQSRVKPDIIPTELAGEWLPEAALRDALIAERLPAALRARNLFWINIRQYLSHDDAHLPPEEYLRHWQEIYHSCMNRDTARLNGLSYVSVEGPVDASDLN